MPRPSYYEAFKTALATSPFEKFERDDLLAALEEIQFPGAPILPSADPANEPQLGRVKYLPKGVPRDSIVYAQDHVNEGAFGHPVTPVLAGIMPRGGKAFFCSPGTSFTEGKGLINKYSGSGNKEHQKSMLNQYLQVQGNETADNELSKLHLHEKLSFARGKMSAHQCFNTSGGFWIEAKYLQDWRDDGKRVELTERSLRYLQWAYSVAENYRNTVGNPSRLSPPPSRTPSPPVLMPSLPMPTPYVQYEQPAMMGWYGYQQGGTPSPPVPMPSLPTPMPYVQYEQPAMMGWYGYQQGAWAVQQPMVPAFNTIAPAFQPAWY